MVVECRVVNAILTTSDHTLTTKSGENFNNFVPDDKDQNFTSESESTTQVSSGVKVKLVPWILTADGTGGHLITMVIVPARPRQEDEESPVFMFEKERANAYERIGMFRIAQDGEGNEALDSFPIYRNGVPETITLV